MCQKINGILIAQFMTPLYKPFDNKKKKKLLLYFSDIVIIVHLLE